MERETERERELQQDGMTQHQALLKRRSEELTAAESPATYSANKLNIWLLNVCMDVKTACFRNKNKNMSPEQQLEKPSCSRRF